MDTTDASSCVTQAPGHGIAEVEGPVGLANNNIPPLPVMSLPSKPA